MPEVTRAEVCIAACADAWRGDGEVLASPFGVIPMIAARLARATFEPELVLSDGEAMLVSGVWPVGAPAPPGAIEGWLTYRAVLELAWRGRRHVMMAPSQIDAFGNANLSCIGDFQKPKAQLLGVRGAPGNTVNHPTSYWVPSHARRAFVETVDMVAGVGYDRARRAGLEASRFHNLRRVVSNLGVFDFGGADNRMRLISVHPGVSVSDVRENTSFEVDTMTDIVETRIPTTHECELIRSVIDPEFRRNREVAE